MNSDRSKVAELPIQLFDQQKDWAAWLNKNHGKSPGIWLRLAKKNSDRGSVSYPEAVESALCYGWIDGQKKSDDDNFWLQKFTPRSAKSIWSRINRDKALLLIESGRMMPSGLKEVERARTDGRWDAAYDSASKSTVPADFQAALDASPRAREFFVSLDSSNRYAVLFRIQTAKKAETRARRIQDYTSMLERHEKFHP
ncbi:YdeI/OmpD-associated family protein [Collimonas antrihumi]|uniref:YdeI/OmpD-associated family protein n=1 Tax=Collimonas antrihumi TaxID=1940615 RepID=UPI001B8CA1C6|nr:YdeI/OmpD-associated family protein [Collimonas antrihumi]